MFKFKFLMDVDEYKKAIKFYGEKFKLKSRWVVSVVDSFPSEWKMNYENSEKVVACTNWMTTTVLFKSSLLTMPAFLGRAYIRHEIRHCAQMEGINAKMKEKYGDLANVYTMMIINNDNRNGYKKSLMEADAWLAFFNVFLDIDKVVSKIIKRNWFC